MPLSWNEIKDRALAFAREWAGESREHAEGRSFWDGFFNVFGLTRRRVASFQEPVAKLGGAQGFIDLFWKGELIVEHKSRGKSLDKAYSQALDFAGIAERDLPKRVLVSDFERIRLYELDTGARIDPSELQTQLCEEAERVMDSKRRTIPVAVHILDLRSPR
jgi:hypothetical protein